MLEKLLTVIWPQINIFPLLGSESDLSLMESEGESKYIIILNILKATNS